MGLKELDHECVSVESLATGESESLETAEVSWAPNGSYALLASSEMH